MPKTANKFRALLMVQDGLLRGDDRCAPGPKHFPAFLWPEGEPGHQDDFYGGFMRGDLIFKAALCILYGPTAALRPDGVSEGRRDSIAEIYGIDEVTPALLAYLAMQVRFALDSQGTFGAGDSKKPKTARSGWPLREFYYHILDFIERKMPRTDHQALLDWWNARLFGEGINDAPENGGDLVGHAAPDTAELMLAQARERERRHSEETDDIRRLDSEPGPSGAGSSAAT
ncbi:hypothetical protein OH76DRAFT_1481609 [Lentinus brumalis]|uniref:Uncharacterized protein n=1 Tax=Lentinus brumalis TaxID=2498619 RepID=A0A371DFK3_9APHY|nr:hypothetical protein OH76DRAFT_1481609 [Polyporus brumalis]